MPMSTELVLYEANDAKRLEAIAGQIKARFENEEEFRVEFWETEDKIAKEPGFDLIVPQDVLDDAAKFMAELSRKAHAHWETSSFLGEYDRFYSNVALIYRWKYGDPKYQLQLYALQEQVIGATALRAGIKLKQICKRIKKQVKHRFFLDNISVRDWERFLELRWLRVRDNTMYGQAINHERRLMKEMCSIRKIEQGRNEALIIPVDIRKILNTIQYIFSHQYKEQYQVASIIEIKMAEVYNELASTYNIDPTKDHYADVELAIYSEYLALNSMIEIMDVTDPDNAIGGFTKHIRMKNEPYAQDVLKFYIDDWIRVLNPRQYRKLRITPRDKARYKKFSRYFFLIPSAILGTLGAITGAYYAGVSGFFVGIIAGPAIFAFFYLNWIIGAYAIGTFLSLGPQKVTNEAKQVIYEFFNP